MLNKDNKGTNCENSNQTLNEKLISNNNKIRGNLNISIKLNNREETACQKSIDNFKESKNYCTCFQSHVNHTSSNSSTRQLQDKNLLECKPSQISFKEESLKSSSRIKHSALDRINCVLI